MKGKSFFFDFSKLLGGKKSGWVLTAAGLAGILLIFLSTLLPKGSSAKEEPAPSMDGYAAQIEEKLKTIVGRIAGADDAEVLVTLESGYEYVYADETTENTDKTEETEGGDSRKIQQKDSTEQKYIMVEGADGRQIALRLTELSPRVKGVVIVCAGASDEYIRQEIISAVMAALDIPSRRIYVTG